MRGTGSIHMGSGGRKSGTLFGVLGAAPFMIHAAWNSAETRLRVEAFCFWLYFGPVASQLLRLRKDSRLAWLRLMLARYI